MDTRVADLPDVLTVNETAQLLRIGRNSAYEAIRRGELPSVRIGRRLLVPRVALERLLANAGDRGRKDTSLQLGVVTPGPSRRSR
jgi:excisionase family DNA binding protein